MNHDTILLLPYESKLKMSKLFFCFKLYSWLTTGEITIHALCMATLHLPENTNRSLLIPVISNLLYLSYPSRDYMYPWKSVLCAVWGVREGGGRWASSWLSRHRASSLDLHHRHPWIVYNVHTHFWSNSPLHRLLAHGCGQNRKYSCHHKFLLIVVSYSIPV